MFDLSKTWRYVHHLFTSHDHYHLLKGVGHLLLCSYLCRKGFPILSFPGEADLSPWISVQKMLSSLCLPKLQNGS